MNDDIKKQILSCISEEDVYEMEINSSNELVICLCLYKRLILNGTLQYAIEVMDQVNNIDNEIVGMIYRECICNYEYFRLPRYMNRLKEIGNIVDYTMACMIYYEDLSTEEIYNIINNHDFN